LYGRNAVREALRAGRRRFRQVLIAEGIQKNDPVDDILQLARERGLPVKTLRREELDLVAGGSHQGVALEAKEYPYVDLQSVLDAAYQSSEPALLLVLDLVQNPQNFGTLIRTAEAAGAQGIILQERRAAGVTPAVVQASSGAVEHMLVSQVTNLVQTIERLKNEGIWVFGLDAGPEATDYSQVDLSVPLALVVGSEGTGLRRLVREQCDLLLRLPMRGRVDSLNAAVAGSIALYAALERRLEIGE
jgi:23S rRNA (guanosine2251-2'-O)-methyltransferase